MALDNDGLGLSLRGRGWVLNGVDLAAAGTSGGPVG